MQTNLETTLMKDVFYTALQMGDPHFWTLDGKRYTFNGIGDYHMVQTTDDHFSLQARLQQISRADDSLAKATEFNALVAKEQDGDVIQVQVGYNKGV